MRGVLLAVVVVMSACGPEEQPPPPVKPGFNDAIAYVCEGAMVWPDGSGVALTHVVWSFPDGSVMTTCATEGSHLTGSLTMLYRAKDSGSKTGRCVMTYDVDGNFTSGGFEFAINTGRTQSTVTYLDSDTAGGRRTQSINCLTR